MFFVNPFYMTLREILLLNNMCSDHQHVLIPFVFFYIFCFLTSYVVDFLSKVQTNMNSNVFFKFVVFKMNSFIIQKDIAT